MGDLDRNYRYSYDETDVSMLGEEGNASDAMSWDGPDGAAGAGHGDADSVVLRGDAEADVTDGYADLRVDSCHEEAADPDSSAVLAVRNSKRDLRVQQAIVYCKFSEVAGCGHDGRWGKQLAAAYVVLVPGSRTSICPHCKPPCRRRKSRKLTASAQF